MGALIPALDRIKIFSSGDWENFILEWVDSIRSKYDRVDRCGGAGDMGRDVIATATGGRAWDNFQCKHYDHRLTPTDIWLELGKLVYYTHRGDYTYPRAYSFIAPQGAGTKLSNLLKKPEDLRTGLIANWGKWCRTGITAAHPVDLDLTLKQYLDGLDFSIFDATPPLRIIDDHSKTRWHVARFGGGLPPRPVAPTPPATPAAAESQFVQQLYLAYGDHLKTKVACVDDIAASPDLAGHFADARREFYSAESLRTFSRDTLPPGEYERLQDEIHGGVTDEVRAEHPDGYRRVLAVVKTARFLPITAHPLVGQIRTRDRGGICHQLANDGRVRWVK